MPHSFEPKSFIGHTQDTIRIPVPAMYFLTCKQGVFNTNREQSRELYQGENLFSVLGEENDNLGFFCDNNYFYMFNFLYVFPISF
jgi:hypothetical protein